MKIPTIVNKAQKKKTMIIVCAQQLFKRSIILYDLIIIHYSKCFAKAMKNRNHKNYPTISFM